MSRETLCGASYYEQKYYFNPDFAKLPESIKQDLQILCVTFTEKVGGVFTMFFEEDGTLNFEVQSLSDDGRGEESGSEVEIKKIQREQVELLESLELFYRTFVLNE